MYRAHLDADRVVLPAQEGHQQDIFRFEDRVAFELADPVALVFLPIQQPVSGALERGLEGLMRGRRPSRARRELDRFHDWGETPSSLPAIIGFPTPSLILETSSRPRRDRPRGVHRPKKPAFFRKRCTS